MAAVQRHLLTFNWRSMGLLDYAVPALRLDGSSSGAARSASAGEMQRQDRAAALLAELRAFSVSLQAKPVSHSHNFLRILTPDPHLILSQQLLLESVLRSADRTRKLLPELLLKSSAGGGGGGGFAASTQAICLCL